jgi:hypothetical protein
MSDRAAAFERFSRAVDGPMMVLALAMIPLIVVPLVYDLSPAANSASWRSTTWSGPRSRSST